MYGWTSGRSGPLVSTGVVFWGLSGSLFPVLAPGSGILKTSVTVVGGLAVVVVVVVVVEVVVVLWKEGFSWYALKWPEESLTGRRAMYCVPCRAYLPRPPILTLDAATAKVWNLAGSATTLARISTGISTAAATIAQPRTSVMTSTSAVLERGGRRRFITWPDETSSCGRMWYWRQLSPWRTVLYMPHYLDVRDARRLRAHDIARVTAQVLLLGFKTSGTKNSTN